MGSIQRNEITLEDIDQRQFFMSKSDMNSDVDRSMENQSNAQIITKHFLDNVFYCADI